MMDHSHVVECVLFISSLTTKKVIADADYSRSELADNNNNNTTNDNNTNNNGKNDLNSRLEAVLKKGKDKNDNSKYENLNFVISGSRDKTIKVWNCATGNCLTTFIGHDNWVRALALHHSGKYLYSCSDDKSIRIWDLTNGNCFKKILDAHSHFISSLATNTKYLTLASSSVDLTVKIWELK